MSKLFLILLLGLPTLVLAKTIEIDIHGMTCSFCVEGLHKELSELPDISRVDVSLKSKKVRIVSKDSQLDMARINQAILDAGFTPMEVHSIENTED